MGLPGVYRTMRHRSWSSHPSVRASPLPVEQSAFLAGSSAGDGLLSIASLLSELPPTSHCCEQLRDCRMLVPASFLSRS